MHLVSFLLRAPLQCECCWPLANCKHMCCCCSKKPHLDSQSQTRGPSQHPNRFNCKWTKLASGNIAEVVHIEWSNRSCLAVPHLAHMAFAAFVLVVFCCAVMALVRGYKGCEHGQLAMSVQEGKAAHSFDRAKLTIMPYPAAARSQSAAWI